MNSRNQQIIDKTQHSTKQKQKTLRVKVSIISSPPPPFRATGCQVELWLFSSWAFNPNTPPTVGIE